MNENTGYGIRWKNIVAVGVVILVFTLISIFVINPYRFGLYDHGMVIPFLKASAYSGLYPDDLMLSQKPYYYTYLWSSLALAYKYLGIDLPRLFFFSYFIAIYSSFVAIYLIAKTLFPQKEVAFLSLFFILFPKDSLGGVPILDALFLTRIAVLPFLLFSIYLFLKGRTFYSLLLLGLGVPIHLLSTVYVFVAFLFAAVVNRKHISFRSLFWGIGVFFVLASPILLWKIRYSVDSWHLFHFDLQWIELLRLRASHHIFPFSWDRSLLILSGFFLLLFYASCKYKPSTFLHRTVLSFVVATAFLCLIGTIFSEFLPLPIVLSFQFGRSFKFIEYFAMIYFANYFVTEMKSRENAFDKVLIALVSLGIFYEGTRINYGFIVFLVFVGALISYHAYYRRHPSSKLFVSFLVCILSLFAVTLYARRGGISIENSQERNWVNVQRWAKAHTDINDIFIVPFSSEGFRVESERTVYGDWKDGGFLEYNPSYGNEWFRRMKMLGYKGGKHPLREPKNIAAENIGGVIDDARITHPHSAKIFLVDFIGQKTRNYPLAYKNEKFYVYEVAE